MCMKIMPKLAIGIVSARSSAGFPRGLDASLLLQSSAVTMISPFRAINFIVCYKSMTISIGLKIRRVYLKIVKKRYFNDFKISSYLPQEFSHSSSVRKPFGVLPHPTLENSLHFLSVSSNINPSNIWGQSPHTGLPLQWLSANDKTLLWYYMLEIMIHCLFIDNISEIKYYYMRIRDNRFLLCDELENRRIQNYLSTIYCRGLVCIQCICHGSHNLWK